MGPPFARRFGIALLVALALVLMLALVTALRLRQEGVPLAAYGPSPDAPTRHADIANVAPNLHVVSLSDAQLSERAIAKHSLGELDVETGKIVAADPLVQPERPAFARTVPAGRYPVMLYRAQERVALAELRFAPGTPARWQQAIVPGQDAGSLKEGEIFGYPVDAGLGAFMDVAGQTAFLKREKDLRAALGARFNDIYDDLLQPLLDANGGDELLYAPYPESAANVAIFHSGWGDGFYASYWGLDEAGKPLVLVTDFEVLKDGDGRESGQAAPVPKPQ